MSGKFLEGLRIELHKTAKKVSSPKFVVRTVMIAASLTATTALKIYLAKTLSRRIK